MAALRRRSSRRFDPDGIMRPRRPARRTRPRERPPTASSPSMSGRRASGPSLFDPAGTLRRPAPASRSSRTSRRSPGWAEQDPELYWRAIGEACRRLLAETGGAGATAIGGASTLTTQRGTVVVTDADGVPLRPAIVWLDQRRTDGLPPFGGVGGYRARVPGARACATPSTGFAADCEANWLRADEPETWRAIRHYLVAVAASSIHRLTGRFVDSTAAQVGYLPFDYKRFRWAPAGDWRWTVAPVDPAWLPELVATDRAARRADRRGRRRDTGCRPACRSSPRPPTRPARCSGPARSTPEVAAISYGTAATVNTTMPRYVEADPAHPAVPVGAARARGRSRSRSTAATGWSSGSSASSRQREVARGARARGRAGGPVRRARRERAGGVDGPDPPAVLVARRAHPRPGGEGRDHRLRRRPHPGPPLPGDPRGPGLRAARGRWSGPRSGPGSPLTALRIAGGGAQSPAAVQLTADVFGLPVARGPHPRGVRARARPSTRPSGLGSIRDVRSRGAAMVRVGEVRDPDPAVHALLRRPVSRRSTAGCTSGCSRSTARSGGSPATRRTLRERPLRPAEDGLDAGWLR